MAFCRLVLPLLVLSVAQSFASIHVPVFLWGDLARTSSKANPLTTFTVPEFDGILREELENDPFTVIFIEETLSVEDFSRRNSEGETSFPYLHANIGDSLYLPSVDSAVHALNKLADPEKVDHVKLTENGLSAEIEPESGKFLFINLKDALEGESRADLLRRHNDFMEDMFTKLQERYNKVIGIYTAHFPSWTITESHSRVRRQAEGASNSNDVAIENLLLYANSIVLTEGSNSQTLSNPTATATLNDTTLDATLTSGTNSITLNFISKSGYWWFKSVTLAPSAAGQSAEVLHPSNEVYSLIGFAYRCGQQVTFNSVNDTRSASVTFNDLKVQPFFDKSNETRVYGDSFNCVGFFSAPIWAGLMVTFILLAITFYGIMMMMDIRTMDRFDDPKGKTITITASD